MNNIKIIDHARALELAQQADQIVEAHHKATGETASSVGILLSAIATAADNMDADFTSVTFTIDYTGFGIRYDASLITEDLVIEGIERGLQVMDDIIASEED